MPCSLVVQLSNKLDLFIFEISYLIILPNGCSAKSTFLVVKSKGISEMKQIGLTVKHF